MKRKASRRHIVNSSPDGVHYLLEFFNCEKDQLNSIVFWKKLLLTAAANSTITVLNKHFYRFSPHGITGYLLLSASHISIHTWPEYGYLTCDIFTCGTKEEAKSIMEFIKSNICHKKMKKRKIQRGFRVQSAS